MAYTIAMALRKVLGVETLVMTESREYLSEYFDLGEEVQTLETAFCDWREKPFEAFEDGIDELLENDSLRTGKLLNLWPRGYKVSVIEFRYQHYGKGQSFL